MIEERIAEVRVRVRTDIPDVDVVRPLAEQIVRAALERCAVLLEQRSPGRIVMLRRLPLRWRLDEAALSDPAQIEALAKAAVDAIERISRPPALDPPADAEGAVIFDDEAHFRASYLLAGARGKTAWFYDDVARENQGDPLAALAPPDQRALALAALARLARADALAEVLAARPEAVVAVFAAALGCDWRIASEAARGADPAVVSQLIQVAAGWTALSLPARALALRVHASVLAGEAFDAPKVIATANAVLAGNPGLPAAGATVEESTGARAGTVQQCRDDEPPATAAEGPGDEAPTRLAGLFYLIDRIQELGLAEALWSACLPEGAVLAASFEAFVDPVFAGDAAPRLIGGVEDARCPEISRDQLSDVAGSAVRELAAALPRRGLAEIPPIHVALAGHSTGRLLIATAADAPFPFFAWPAATGLMVDEGLRLLLASWSHRGAATAPPELVALDVQGRLRSGACEIAPALPATARNSTEAALMAIVFGAPVLLFAARLGAGRDGGTGEFVRRYLERPARIRTTADRVDVVFATGQVEVPLRRAGLDRNPGWVPWLRRTVRFVLPEQEAL